MILLFGKDGIQKNGNSGRRTVSSLSPHLSPISKHTMRAYYYDNVSADQRLPHDSGQPVELDHLRKHGLTLSTVPLDTEGGWEPVIDKMANEHGWDNRDTMDVTKEGLGDHFEEMLDKFFTECVTPTNHP